MQYKLISDEAQVKVGLDGAMLNSLVKGSTEYLWQGDSEHWAGQAPVCFPIAGVLRDSKGEAFGKPCNMKRHGIARITPFELYEKHENSVTFIQKSNDETLKMFPFEYELRISYTLVGSTVTTSYTVINKSDAKMPFVIGGHPAFNCPLCGSENFEDYRITFDRKMTKKILRPDHITGLVDVSKRYDALEDSDTINLSHDLFEENDAMIFDNVESKKVCLLGPGGKGIAVEYQDMDNLLIWSACNNANFVALEPWSGISTCSDEGSAVEKKRGMTVLNPDSAAQFKFKITMI